MAASQLLHCQFVKLSAPPGGITVQLQQGPMTNGLRAAHHLQASARVAYGTFTAARGQDPSTMPCLCHDYDHTSHRLPSSGASSPHSASSDPPTGDDTRPLCSAANIASLVGLDHQSRSSIAVRLLHALVICLRRRRKKELGQHRRPVCHLSARS